MSQDAFVSEHSFDAPKKRSQMFVVNGGNHQHYVSAGGAHVRQSVQLNQANSQGTNYRDNEQLNATIKLTKEQVDAAIEKNSDNSSNGRVHKRKINGSIAANVTGAFEAMDALYSSEPFAYTGMSIFDYDENARRANEDRPVRVVREIDTHRQRKAQARAKKKQERESRRVKQQAHAAENMNRSSARKARKNKTANTLNDSFTSAVTTRISAAEIAANANAGAAHISRRANSHPDNNGRTHNVAASVDNGSAAGGITREEIARQMRELQEAGDNSSPALDALKFAKSLFEEDTHKDDNQFVRGSAPELAEDVTSRPERSQYKSRTQRSSKRANSRRTAVAQSAHVTQDRPSAKAKRGSKDSSSAKHVAAESAIAGGAASHIDWKHVGHRITSADDEVQQHIQQQAIKDRRSETYNNENIRTYNSNSNNERNSYDVPAENAPRRMATVADAKRDHAANCASSINRKNRNTKKRSRGGAVIAVAGAAAGVAAGAAGATTSAVSNLIHSKKLIPVAVVFAIMLVSGAMIYPVARDYYISSRNLDRANIELAQVKERNQQIQKGIDTLSTSSGVEDYARAQYGWVGQDEQAVAVVGLESDGLAEGAIPVKVESASIKAEDAWYNDILDSIFFIEDD